MSDNPVGECRGILIGLAWLPIGAFAFWLVGRMFSLIGVGL